MITSAISSAARLSLAPAKFAGQMAGALLRGLRGDTSGNTSSARRSAGQTPARRSRTKAQSKRTTARSSAKRQPKRTAARARPKRQTSAGRSKRTAARTSAQAQPRTSAQARPKRADRPEPLGDVAIAREVESTIFRDIDADRRRVDVKVAEGVVRLRGEVATPDLINELEARATRVPQVRRVENLLRTPAPPAEPAPAEAQKMDPAGTSGVPAPAESVGGARAPRTGRWGDNTEAPTGTPEAALEPAGRPEGDKSADQDESVNSEHDTSRPGW